MEFARGETRAGAAAHRADMDDLRTRDVARLVAARAQPAAEVGILPVEEVALVEPADLDEAVARGSACRHPSPSRRSHCPCRPATRSAAGRLRRAAVDRGNNLVSSPWRPNRPVHALGSPRALACTLPSPFSRLRRRDRAPAVFTESAQRAVRRRLGRRGSPGSAARAVRRGRLFCAWFTAAPNPTLRGLRTSVTPGTHSTSLVAAVAGRVVDDNDLRRTRPRDRRRPTRCTRADGVPH